MNVKAKKKKLMGNIRALLPVGIYFLKKKVLGCIYFTK
jgi:hypothetical protein